MSTQAFTSSPGDTVRPITDTEFGRFQALIHAECGIQLAAEKQALVVSRLGRRLRELGLRTFTEYHALVLRSAPERVILLDRMSTNETRFFRESSQFDHLDSKVFPAWAEDAREGRRPHALSVWSAGCATGEEPWSVAMALLDRFPSAEGWTLDLLATDLSTRALAAARDGVYPVEKAAHIPERLLKAYMLRGVGRRVGEMAVGPQAREIARFARLNLIHDEYPGGPFDLLLCRNVMIYFDAATRRRVTERLLRLLAPEGLLLLGHAESLAGQGHAARAAGPMMYVAARP